MWLQSIRLKNIKGFIDSEEVEFSSGINVLVGPNNAGKSTILRSVYLLQPSQTDNEYKRNFASKFLRKNSLTGEILMELANPTLQQFEQNNPHTKWSGGGIKKWKPKITISIKANDLSFQITEPDTTKTICSSPICNRIGPNNFIYPYFSRRKPDQMQESVSEYHANLVDEKYQNLASKIDRLANREFPDHETFRDTCRNIFGFTISSSVHGNGKLPGLTLQDGSFISSETMGDGTINILTFLSHLASSSGNLYLVEEIENDIHPKALKALLEFIIEKSESNQFIIATHSNIVVRTLGAASNTKLFSVAMELDKRTKLPISHCAPLSDKAEERIKLLENLGYDIFDSFLWKGYLILEESTAEIVIRDVLIPLFFPLLTTRLKTIAASGVQDVAPRLADLLRVFVFIHTTPAYKQRAWIAVDGGEKGKKTIETLRLKFRNGWPTEHFRCFSAENFEDYYPSEFAKRADNVLKMPHGLAKQKAKGELAKSVVEWAVTNPAKAKSEFKICANEILALLRQIHAKLGE